MIKSFLFAVKKLFIIIILVAFAAIFFFIYAFISSSSRLKPLTPVLNKANGATAVIDGHQFKLHLAISPIDREKGLSIFSSLPQDEGMLFIFPISSYYGFWMKDMKFPIDILWIEGDKLVGFKSNAPALAVKNISDLPIYNPPEPVDKVLEINAGLAEKYGFKAGDAVSIKLGN
jgi:uncharacterized membrane protein (UPF0127 family)